jgi:hypothetical protein
MGSELLSLEGDLATVRVADHYAVEWLTHKWMGPISRTLASVLEVPSVEVRFICQEGVGGPASQRSCKRPKAL